ncbi:MAG: glycosyltransferase family 4 protein [Leptolyngbyaceae cyanobacterium MAG.088]|nr:glycosyltransferase family 4 protein [Leptolyngbyaceae cyanobacterium MAG.088]
MSHQPLLVNLSALIQKPTGISVYARNLLPELKPLNPMVLGNQNFAGIKQLTIPNNLSPEYGLKGHVKRLWWLQNSLPRIYQELESTLIFSPLPEAPIYRKCRFITTVHDLIPLRFPRPWSPLTNYFRYVVPLILREAVHIICDSDSTARDLEEFYEIKREKMTTIPLAYDRKTFKFDRGQTEANYFLYIGRQDTYKNLGRLVEAFSQICAVTDTQLWFVGPRDQRYTPQLVDQVKHLDIESRVRFLDYVAYSELPKLLGGALTLTFPSLWEGFGLPALEAMACGTPVIASNLSSLPEVVGAAAILVDPYNVAELADAMKMVANDAQLRAQLQVKGLERAKQFTWEKTGQHTMEVLRRFL